MKELLEEALAGQEESWTFEPIKPSPKPYAYRNKMEFSFGDERKDGPLALGLHKRGGFYDIVTVTGCRIVDEDYRRVLQTSLSYFQKDRSPIPPAQPCRLSAAPAGEKGFPYRRASDRACHYLPDGSAEGRGASGGLCQKPGGSGAGREDRGNPSYPE